jgi:uncharacterized cupin superfamily protein
MIEIKKATAEYLEALGVKHWPVWTKEASVFDWEYGDKETCYIINGEVEVIPEKGAPVHFGKGDVVVFAKGLKCVWKVKSAVEKHYRFG